MNKFLKKLGLARAIIFLFLVMLFIIGAFYNIKTDVSLYNILTRFGMNGLLVLSMVPMIQAGCGLNFGIPVGIIAGLLGSVISLEFDLTGLIGIACAILFAIIFAILFGFLYGVLLNKIKGDEMIVATYVGYSSISFMNIMWLWVPFKNPASVLGYSGSGLRATISVEKYWHDVISKFMAFRITQNLIFPTGMILFFVFVCSCVWLFFKTKTGTAVTAVGSNPEYARASGIDINKMRIIATIISTVIAAIGIIIYEQSFGFIQLYDAPRAFMFPAVAAILLGGASVNKASIVNVIIDTVLFQGVLTMTPSVINSVVKIDMSEVMRLIISSGLILYALTRKEKN